MALVEVQVLNYSAWEIAKIFLLKSKYKCKFSMLIYLLMSVCF